MKPLPKIRDTFSVALYRNYLCLILLVILAKKKKKEVFSAQMLTGDGNACPFPLTAIGVSYIRCHNSTFFSLNASCFS